MQFARSYNNVFIIDFANINNLFIRAKEALGN
jgi:hypothetical protein